MNSATIHWDFRNYVNKEITFVRSNVILMYARGKHIQLNIGKRCMRDMGLGSMINARMVIQ